MTVKYFYRGPHVKHPPILRGMPVRCECGRPWPCGKDYRGQHIELPPILRGLQVRCACGEPWPCQWSGRR